MSRERHPGDPRNLPGYRPRGPKRFHFTYRDLSDASGLAVASIQKAVYRRQLDPRDVTSLARWLMRILARKKRK